jgi:hypothetical protein
LRPLAAVAAALTVRFLKYLSDADADPAIHGHAALHCIQKISRTEGDLPYARSGIRHKSVILPLIYLILRSGIEVKIGLIYLFAEEVPRECPRACTDDCTKGQGFSLLLSFWRYLSVRNFAPTVYELLG